MQKINEGQSLFEIVKLTDTKIITTEVEKRNGLIFGRTKCRMLRRKGNGAVSNA